MGIVICVCVPQWAFVGEVRERECESESARARVRAFVHSVWDADERAKERMSDRPHAAGPTFS